MKHLTTIIDTALGLRAAGISVIPIRLDRFKAPSIASWKESMTRIADEAELRAWFRVRNWDAATGPVSSFPGLAAVCGAVSGGLECLDFDEPKLFERWADDVDAIDKTLIKRLVIVRTPADGVHCWYRCDVVQGNHELASRPSTDAELAANAKKKLQVMIETRGEGGYALLPGSPPQCHDLHKEYAYDPAGCGALTNVQQITPAERQRMHDLASSFNRIAGRISAPPMPKDSTVLLDLRPGNDFDLRGYPWQEILEVAGWQLVSGTWDEGKLVRPGKDPRDGCSATIGVCRGSKEEPLLNVFTSSDSTFPKGSYGKFRAWAAINFSGDLGRAASALSRLGFGSPAKANPERNGKHHETNGQPANPDAKPWEQPTKTQAPAGISLAELMKLDLPEPSFAVEGLLCEGLTILGGKPKMGKSWLSLLMGWAVAAGEDLDGRKVKGGDVLFLALEDTKRRLQSRVKMLKPSVPWEFPERLTIHTDWQRADSGGLNHIAEWAESHKETARLVIIDTLAKFRRGKKPNGNAYDDDYEDLGQIKKMCDHFNISAIVIHHTRKLKSEDPFDDLSGTLGITGAADGILILDRDRGMDGGQLFVTGRDVTEVTIPLTLDKATYRWTLGHSSEGIDTASRGATSPASNKVDQCCKWILQFLADYAHPANELDIAAKAAGHSPSAVRDAKQKLGRNGTGAICFEKKGEQWWTGLSPKSDWKLRPVDGMSKSKKPSESSESSESWNSPGKNRSNSPNSPVNSPDDDPDWIPAEFNIPQ
jgi:hypothetical protein